jgi:hypothetical protein
MKADSLTKTLLLQKYQEFRKQIVLVDIINKIMGSGLEPSFGEIDQDNYVFFIGFFCYTWYLSLCSYSHLNLSNKLDILSVFGFFAV